MTKEQKNAWSLQGERKGFSLIELMVVMAIIALLTGISAGVLPSFLLVQKQGAAVRSLALIIEQARNQAISKNTYVWLGFSKDGSSNSLRVATMISASGALPEQAEWGSKELLEIGVTDNDGDGVADIQLLSKTVLLESAMLGSPDSLANVLAQGYRPGNGLEAGADSPQFKVKSPGGNVATFDILIRFSPSGDASSERNEVGMVDMPLLKPSSTESKPYGVLQLNLLTGQTRSYRL